MMLFSRGISRYLGSAQALGQPNQDRSNLRFVVVTHGQASDPFWSVVQNGVDQAAKDMGVKVEYQAPAPSTWSPWRS